MDERHFDKDALFWLLVVRGAAGDRTLLRYRPDPAVVPTEVSCLDEATLDRLGFTVAAKGAYAAQDWRLVEPDLRWLRNPGHHLVPYNNARYPTLLRAIPDPPPALFVRGDTASLGSLQVAIVGSRNPTPDGRRQAFEFGRALARNGIATTSGLAVGIDSQAHLGALHEDGITVAVLGSGPDIIYPGRNRELAERIAMRGAVVSEFPIQYPPMAENFPRRNRIISGLCVGTLVVEAAVKSGSLITARHALDQGREVFAIPGSIRNPMTRGCHALLRQGAKLVEQIEDILEEIGPLAGLGGGVRLSEPVQSAGMKPLDAEFKLLLDNIGFEPVHIDFLIEATELTVQQATASLTSMEIAGLIEALPGGNYMRR